MKKVESIVSFECPSCHNKTLYDIDSEPLKVSDVDYHDRFICDECGSEYLADPQYNGTIKFLALEESRGTPSSFKSVDPSTIVKAIFYDDCELVESTKFDSEELEAIVNGLDENGYNLNVLSSIKEGLWALFGYQGKDAFDVVEELVTKGYIDSNVLIDAGYTPTSLINESLSPYKKEEFKKQLQDELYDKFIDLARTPEWGYESEKEVEDYLAPMLSISVDPDDEDYLIVEFRAEVNYEELEEIGDSLNKVIQRYDKDAYFEPVDPGITRAYVKISDQGLEESLLMEAPRISFDDADLMNPDSIDLKSMIRKAQDKEDAEAAAKADAEKVAALKDKADKALANMASFEDWEDQIDSLHSDVVPAEGKAESLGGELVRAIVRIIYRDRNDGDKFFQGYGLETCGSSAMFLYNNGFDTQIDHIIENAGRYEDDDAYSDAINKLGQLVLDRIQNEPELLTTLNDVDSRDVDYTYIEEQQPLYDFDFYGSDDIVELVDAGILNSWKLKEYVEQQLEWNSACRGCEVERPLTHYDHSVQVTRLTRDGLDYVEQELFNNPDSFWQDLVDEYSDELEELRNGYDDEDEPEDDIDEE